MSQYFKIGKLAASFGLKGELILEHSLGKKTSLKGLETIFIEEKKDSFFPYFITNTKIKSHNEIFISLEGIENKEIARKLTPKEVWVSIEDFEKFAAKSSPISLLNYTLISNGKSIGEIIEVIEMPHQILCSILINNKEALIPIHDNNLINIDKKYKTVEVELPEGLLEIYQ
jgi:16S rRNA processing protein RimM